MTSIVTILDHLSYPKPSCTGSHSNCNQTYDRYRIIHDIRSSLPQRQPGKRGEAFNQAVSPGKGSVSSNTPLHDVKVMNPLYSEEALQEEDRIWSDLDMTCFSESDSENFDGDRDSKNYFKPENLESCQLGLNTGFHACIETKDLDSCSREFNCDGAYIETKALDSCSQDGEGLGSHGDEAVRDTALDCVVGKPAGQYSEAECGQRDLFNNTIDCTTKAQEGGSNLRHIISDEVKGERYPQEHNSSLCFNATTSTKDDSGFSSSDGVLT